MDIVYISDNYYLCAGAESLLATAITLRDTSDINEELLGAIQGKYPVVSIENIHLRKLMIKSIKKVSQSYSVMMKELNNDEIFRMGNVLYCCNNFPLPMLANIAGSKIRRYTTSLTRREAQVLKKINQRNVVIAAHLNISIKTVSTYKLRIMHKLNAVNKNNLVLCKLKATLDDSFFSEAERFTCIV
ncbi:TPA: helix-turn-helix transcriptional regulator [Enterobacter hormaechei subsp. steigerwaltii]|nr:helix-turn-helix transcriptional regulator [Enterobacter hormaechei subsp. steigerwaltii]